MRMHVIWSHGKESGPYGTKISTLADIARSLGFYVDSLDYRGMENPDERVGKLVEHCGNLAGDIILAGSSMGGYVAAAAASFIPIKGLFLLAPALYVPGYPVKRYADVNGPVVIVHGWRDDVIPVEGSFTYAKEKKASLFIIDGDHRLKDNIPELCAYFKMFLQAT